MRLCFCLLASTTVVWRPAGAHENKKTHIHQLLFHHFLFLNIVNGFLPDPPKSRENGPLSLAFNVVYYRRFLLSLKLTPKLGALRHFCAFYLPCDLIN